MHSGCFTHDELKSIAESGKKHELTDAEPATSPAKKIKSSEELKEFKNSKFSEKTAADFSRMAAEQWVTIANCGSPCRIIEYYNKHKEYIDPQQFSQQIKFVEELIVLYELAKKNGCCECGRKPDAINPMYCCLTNTAIIDNRPMLFKMLLISMMNRRVTSEFTLNFDDMTPRYLLSISNFDVLIRLALNQSNPFFLSHLMQSDKFNINRDVLQEYIEKALTLQNSEYNKHIEDILHLM